MLQEQESLPKGDSRISATSSNPKKPTVATAEKTNVSHPQVGANTNGNMLRKTSVSHLTTWVYGNGNWVLSILSMFQKQELTAVNWVKMPFIMGGSIAWRSKMCRRDNVIQKRMMVGRVLGCDDLEPSVFFVSPGYRIGHSVSPAWAATSLRSLSMFVWVVVWLIPVRWKYSTTTK